MHASSAGNSGVRGSAPATLAEYADLYIIIARYIGGAQAAQWQQQ
jgi:hypothetical protein